MERKYSLEANGRNRRFKAEADEPLLWVLRDKLKLTGTKFGCGEGVCGACSVLIDGEVVRSCLVVVGSIEETAEIVTVEGLAQNGNLTPIQQAFIKHTAFQCGFCTPGMLITITALLKKHPNPSRKQIIKALDSNLCRCGSHVNIIEAIESLEGTSSLEVLR
jgi:aerobic-type carbon monoxide dehydrogenase small subunit (CoxS/CutS family)